ncbi:hypothetical protein [Pelagicoccus albus]|uniref:Uncharacterized protein n=1 Tax=Pelagicoccus albus TaxID=415222 RepID=A0A7X1B368_9BACT|nr:hypothetical protein [Pelagicoccus albus]MBC2604810.1 hypothetical protein [Pelagicoccus albus]MBC2606313.1 hypothetical protein [Pelagicoccus albus]
MTIGAFPKDYPSIVDTAPQQFGIFYWPFDARPAEQHCATITKKKDSFIYEYRPHEGDPETKEYERKEDLVDRMKDDNRRLNDSGKCVIEF